MIFFAHIVKYAKNSQVPEIKCTRIPYNVQVPAKHPSAVGCGRDGDAAVQRSGGQVS